MDTSSAPSSSCTDTAQVPPYSSTKPCGVENTEVSLNISYTSAGESTFQDSASSSTLASSDTTDTENISSEAPSYYFTALSSADTEDSEANLFYTPAIDAKTRTTYSVIPSVSSNDDDAKLVDTFLNLCKDTIQKSAQHLSRKVESGDFMMNRLQCDLLVQRLVSGTQATLAHVQQLPLLDKTAIPVLHELHQALLDAETLVKASCAISNDSHWPRAALEQGDMKETFSKLLYEVQWYTSVLLSILVDNSKESRVKFEPEMCDGQLGFGDELDLLIAMKKDEESLKTRLRALKVDDPTEKELADQLLNQMEAMLLKNSRQQGLAADDQLLNRLKSLSSDFVFLNPDDLKLGGKSLGRGAFGEVRTTNLLGIECAMKIIYVPEGWTTQDVKDMIRPEMNAIKDLGHHPHIVRLFCYSIKTEEACYLIMERMQMDLSKCLLNHRIKGDDGKENYGKLSHVDAVSLMLQIGEGIEYIHSKDMVHRDLKPQNILVNLENPGNSFSRICSVKIADFGLTKSKGASRTCSNNTINRGTTSYMAPEVMSFEEDDPKKGRFNPKKADVYSFAIMCSVVLTGWINPYVEDAKFPSLDRKTKKQVKTGLRPKLPKDCLPRLATLITRCWAGNYYERPLFPEICRELRFIKGLLLKGELYFEHFNRLCVVTFIYFWLQEKKH
jgi:hypothetical protein